MASLRTYRRRLRPFAALAILGCSSGPGAGPSTTYVPAYASSFNGFCSWSSAVATAPNDASDGVHLGPLRVYWNQSPPSGSHSFPVGTLILKESQEADPTVRTIFAMAKVGGGYNAGGATDWEWFSLHQNDDCTVSLLWSGPVAPAGETYAGTPAGDCNACHAQASDNDFVWDSALQLSNF